MRPELPPQPKPGYSALREHRWSAPGADYFVTFNLKRPAAGLCERATLAALEAQRFTLEAEGSWIVRTWVVMPDHVHVLFTLGAAGELAKVMRLFKGRLSATLRRHQLHWQPGYHEHHMRPDEDRLSVFLYIFLNPYRADLISVSKKWPGYFCSTEDWIWFGPLTNADVPFPEWLK